jgi:hypothetical protein
MLFVTLEETDIYDLKKIKCFNHIKTLLAYTKKRHCNFKDILILIIKKKYLFNIIILQKIHCTRRMGSLQLYKFLE